jgi:hypothetical protein
MAPFEKLPGERADHLNASEKKGGIDNLLVQKQMAIRKEILSAHFTIWAAAFGLVSDGCKFFHTNLMHIKCLSRLIDQNNLMTMANVELTTVTSRNWLTAN